jgi:hypothetical protein
VLLKETLTTKLDWKHEARIVAAISAVKQLHSSNFELILAQTLPSIFRNIPEPLLNKGVLFLVEFGDYWNVLPADVQLKLEAYVEALPPDLFHLVEDVIEYGPLKRQAEQRIRVASDEDISHFAFMCTKFLAPVADRCISLYLGSWSSDQANKTASSVKANSEYFSAEQVRTILVGIKRNDQLLRSSSLSSTIITLRQSKIINDKEFESILEANGLHRFVQDPDDIPF